MITMYSDNVIKILKQNKSQVGDVIQLTTTKGQFEGMIMPRSNQGDQNSIVIKLDSGYNIGININNIQKIKNIKSIKPTISKPSKMSKSNEKGDIAIIGCGGTIASKIEYKTGAVFPALSGNELIESYPEINEISTIHTKNLFSILSEDMTPTHWSMLAKEIETQIKNGAKGIVVTHGTDTMHYTSSALSFMLQNIPVPVIMTGAQRSSDRASSDAKINLISSMLASKSNLGEIGVCMHANSNDNINYVHRGNRVRKMHTSKRDAFKSIDQLPLIKIDWQNKKLEAINKYKKIGEGKFMVKPKINDNVALIHIHPGIKPKLIDSLSDYDGIVLSGTGLGHVSTNPFNDKLINPIISNIKSLIDSDVTVVMAPQTIYGRLNLNVYTAGRLLKSVGTIGHNKDWTPETAFAKLCWALGQTKKNNEVKQLMEQNIANESNEKSVIL